MLTEYEHLKALPTDLKLELIDELQLSIDQQEYKNQDAPEATRAAVVQDALDRIAAMKDDPTLGISIDELWKRVDAARS